MNTHESVMFLSTYGQGGLHANSSRFLSLFSRGCKMLLHSLQKRIIVVTDAAKKVALRSVNKVMKKRSRRSKPTKLWLLLQMLVGLEKTKKKFSASFRSVIISTI